MPETRFYIDGLDDPVLSLLTSALSRTYACPVDVGMPRSGDGQDSPEDLRILIYMGSCAGRAGAVPASSGHLKKIVVCDDGGKANAEDENTEVLPRPFRLGTLVDCCNGIIRSHERLLETPDMIEMGAYCFFPVEDRLLTKESGEEIRLTDKEREILLALYRNGGKPIERQKLLQEVWGFVEGVETHTLETHIYRLRQKIEPDPGSPEYILTSENGYRIGK